MAAPSRKKMGKLDAFLSGSLIRLGGVELGKFTEDVVHYGTGAADVSRSIYYFVPDTGEGRLSYGLAQAAKEWIYTVMVDSKVVGGKARSVRYEGPPIRSKKGVHGGSTYADWKNAIPEFAGRPVGFLTGSAAAALGVIRSSGGGHQVGLRANVWTNSPVPYVLPLDYNRKKVNVDKYWATHEFGADGQSTKPLMTGAMLSFIRKNVPEWGPALHSYFETVWGEPSSKEARKLQEQAARAAKTMAGTSNKQVKVFNADADKWEGIADKQADGLEGVAKILADLDDLQDAVLSAGKTMDAGMSKKFREGLTDSLTRKLGHTSKEAKTIVEAILSGQEQDISDKRNLKR